MWLPLVADDLLAISAGQFIRASLSFVLVLFLVVGLPLSWKKIEGGESMSWVGYEVLLREAKLGVTEKRALWLGSWYSKLLEEKVVKVGRFQEGLGRAAFVCSALEYDRPFLAPLYTFASLYDPEATRPLPLYVLATLQFLKGQLARRRHFSCAVEEMAWSEAWRVDAKAEGEELGIGGWWPQVDVSGCVQKHKSPWFAVRLSRSSAPWAFRQDGVSFRLIATLEALALLVALKVSGPQLEDGRRLQTLQLPAFTDNKSNGYAVNKLMSTKFPLCAVLMELSAQMEDKGMRVNLQWTPREFNSEADALSNFDFRGFSKEHRIGFDLKETRWLVLDALLDFGAKFQLEKKKAQEVSQRKTQRPHRKKRNEFKLKVVDPW